MNQNPRYPVVLRPLNDEDGGGWIAIVPDLPGCMSDGASGDEAFKNVLDAITAWESVTRDDGQKQPVPDSSLASMLFAVPLHLRPQIERLAQEIEESQDDGVSRDQIMAGIMLQMMRDRSFGGLAGH
jgi:antitoxin HicB